MNRTQALNNQVQFVLNLSWCDIETMYFRYGGIYLDDTQIVTRSMDPLRKLSCSMPYEKKGTLMNGVIVAEPNAAFLKKWFFLGYQDFEVKRFIQSLTSCLIFHDPTRGICIVLAK